MVVTHTGVDKLPLAHSRGAEVGHRKKSSYVTYSSYVFLALTVPRLPRL